MIPEPSTLDRVAELERRVLRLEKLVETIYSKEFKSETNDLVRNALNEIAEQLRTKVAEYVTAVSDPSTDAANIRQLGQEVDRLRKLLQAVVDKEHELPDR